LKRAEGGNLHESEGGSLHQVGELCQNKPRLDTKNQSMFRENKQHLQPYLISNVNDLPEKIRKRLVRELTPYKICFGS
jgi:hypothetical protein